MVPMWAKMRAERPKVGVLVMGRNDAAEAARNATHPTGLRKSTRANTLAKR